MDDCSTDNSLETLRKYKEKHPDITTLLINESNSGGVFHQWKKGIESATSELCWIAESDDFCEPDFLQKVIPPFEDTDVAISYSRFAFVDQNGNVDIQSFNRYVYALSHTKWRENYINDGKYEVAEALGIMNTIPNVSGVVFRKPETFALLEDHSWYTMKICGDWMLYIHLLISKKLAYTVETCSYFRCCTDLVSAGTSTYDKPVYYREHEKIARTVALLYDVAPDVIAANYHKVKDMYNSRFPCGNEQDFDKLYNLCEVLNIIHSKTGQTKIARGKKYNG
jgi:glycosyltransferase involved in cell wall biosynthesis